jgi:hypothetical protein
MMRHLIRAAGVVTLLAAPLAAQPPAPLRARLAPVPLDIAMQATVAGLGEASATLAGASLTVTGTYRGLKSPATVARVHESPNRGIRGPAVGDLTASGGVAGTIGGRVTLTAAQAEAFRKGLLYVQVHSEKAPDGTLWGWLLPAAEPRR